MPSGSPPPKQQRSKHSRPPPSGPLKTSSVATVRQRSPCTNDQQDPRPPAKRARKAINCEPCRNSKLKCDRARPCSSCVLRGTVSACYQGSDGQPLSSDETRLDPAAEFARVRYSLSLLENYCLHGSRKEAPTPSFDSEPSASASNILLDDDGPDLAKDDAPGMHGTQGQSGFYTGPTSAASHLIMDDVRSRTPSEERQNESTLLSHDYDRDLLDLLPPLHIIDAILDYYFEYCNWVYRHVNQHAFQIAWQKFKTGGYPDRIVLGTIAGVLAVSIRYLPPGHELLAGLSGSLVNEKYYLELSAEYYDVMKKALRRYQDETKVYTIELVELLLLRSHYLTFIKTDPEEIWTVRGQLVTIGTAMGLHRDPGKHRFSREAAERRRWAWWHIILHERWQAFLFGRPLSIASHHFNTQLPSHCDPELDKSGRLYLPNIALFRLAFILGEIMEDAVSLRPVPYESFQQKDRLLTQWFDSLPSELDLDEFRMARSLSSPVTSIRRLGVQSLIIRIVYHHIRFTLHRPFAGVKDSHKTNDSLEIAVSSADKILSFAAQTTPEFLATTTGVKTHPPIHGHFHWRPFHVFSAAMFFSFQLIQTPEQLGASLFRSYIRRAIGLLEQSRNMPVAEKALTVLLTLAPLYSEEFLALDSDGRQKEKAIILSTVKTLAFPYQDPPPVLKVETPPTLRTSAIASTTTTRHGGSSLGGSPTTTAESPGEKEGIGYSALGGINQYGSGSSSSLSNIPSYPVPASNGASSLTQGYTPSPPINQPSFQQMWQNSSSQTHSTSTLPSPTVTSSNGNLYMQQQQHQQQQFLFGDSIGPSGSATTYVPAVDDWGGSVGFGQSEWMRFMDVLQRSPELPIRQQPGGGTF